MDIGILFKLIYFFLKKKVSFLQQIETCHHALNCCKPKEQKITRGINSLYNKVTVIFNTIFKLVHFFSTINSGKPIFLSSIFALKDDQEKQVKNEAASLKLCKDI